MTGRVTAYQRVGRQIFLPVPSVTFPVAGTGHPGVYRRCPMNEVAMLAVGDALARTSEVLRPGECVAFRDYLERVVRSEAQIAAVFGGAEPFVVSVDGQPVDGPESTLPVTAA